MRFRNEQKYYITDVQYHIMRPVLSALMRLDENADERGEYHIRSLYFDDMYNTSLDEKLAGTAFRDKYRIRMYKRDPSRMQMEIKSKAMEYISKRTSSLTMEECSRILAGDADFLLEGDAVRQQYFRRIREARLRPVVIVDYFREAYVLPVEDVRITFDKEVRTGLYRTDLFHDVPSIVVLPPKHMVLEVKFNHFLPDTLRSLLGNIPSQRSPVSKYVLCRRFAEAGI